MADSFDIFYLFSIFCCVSSSGSFVFLCLCDHLVNGHGYGSVVNFFFLNNNFFLDRSFKKSLDGKADMFLFKVNLDKLYTNRFTDGKNVLRLSNAFMRDFRNMDLPSMPGKISANAPKVVRETILTSKSLPTG